MKKLISIFAISLLIFATGCSDKKISTFNIEIEKAKIEKLINIGLEMGLKGDTTGLVNWTRKHTLPQFHFANGEDIILLNLDSLIKNSPNSSSTRFISYEPDKSSIIKISQNGDMAYYLGKFNFTIEFDSANTKVQKNIKGVELQIFEKKDSVWAKGDYMSVHK